MNLRDELQRIYDKNGALTPAMVVKAAKNPNHPLHNRFEWDDTKAAAKYRLEQGHRLIQSVRVSDARDDEDRSVRAFLPVPQPGGRQPSYTPVEDVIRDEFTRRIVLNDMEREWRSLKRRYEQFEEFTALVLNDLGAA